MISFFKVQVFSLFSAGLSSGLLDLLRKFDPFPPENTRRVTNRNDLQNLFNVAEHEGKEERGRRFIRWRFIRGLERDLTPNFMAKYERKFTHLSTPDTSFHISYATLKTVR